jgi:hypothetical protein
MAERKHGKRHPLLPYRRYMDSLWQVTLILGLLLGGLWWQITSGKTPLIVVQNPNWLLSGAVVILGFTAIILIGRFSTYVQPRDNHLRLATPFFRLNISYRRVLNAHPANFSSLFPPHQAGPALRSFLSPFYGQTVVILELNKYPLNPRLLRLFLSRQMFSPNSTGFVLVVSDWLDLITEIDTFKETWRQSQDRRRANPYRIFK